MDRLKKIWDKSFTNWYYRILFLGGFWFFLLFFWMQESIFIKINGHQHYSVSLVGIGLTLFLYYPLVYIIVPLLKKRKYLFALALFVPYYVITVVLRYYHIQQIVSWYNDKKVWVAGED